MKTRSACHLQGDMLAVSPYESHHDPRFFHPNPEDYNPNRRGLQCPGSSLHEVPGVGGIAGLVSGGGRYRCIVLSLDIAAPPYRVKSTVTRALMHCRY